MKNALLQIINLLIISLIIFTFVLCNKDRNPITEIEETSVNDYFPLQVGNTWTYELSAPGHDLDGKILSVTIVDTKSVDGKKYFLFKSDFPSIESPWDSALFRISNLRVFRRINDKDYLWYDFEAQKGHSYQIPLGASGEQTGVVLENKDVEVIVPVGTFENCYQFHFFIAYDHQWVESFAPHVGLVDVSYATLVGLSCHLKEAKINNMTYSNK